MVRSSRILSSAVVGAAVLLAAGCGSSTQSRSSTATALSTSQAPSPSSPLVGRWEREQTCDQLVDALRAADLEPVLPSLLPDWFPDATPDQLARRQEPCRGATTRPHSHFFTQDGQFGSVDGTGQQVDDGRYEIVDATTVHIGQGVFTYSITNGDTLVLHPVIEDADRRQALAHPLDVNTAGWQAAVAWGGLPWKRVDCDNWC